MLLYMAFGGLGGAVIYLTFTIDHSSLRDPDSPTTPSPEESSTAPVIVLTLCILCGAAYIMCCLFWCCAMIMTQACRSRPRDVSDYCKNFTLDPNTNYTLLSCCFWMVVVFFVAVTAALLVDYFDRHSISTAACNTSFDIFCLQFVLVWLMVFLVLFCVCCNVVTYYGGSRREYGNVFLS
jgi:sterol desaturase/sphingolipid hydroxylase (fatty acid hydroxylase superfamily)